MEAFEGLRCGSSIVNNVRIAYVAVFLPATLFESFRGLSEAFQTSPELSFDGFWAPYWSPKDAFLQACFSDLSWRAPTGFRDPQPTIRARSLLVGGHIEY